MVFWHQPSTALFIVYFYSFFNDLESLDHQKFLSVTHTLLILYSFHVFFFHLLRSCVHKVVFPVHGCLHSQQKNLKGN